MRVVYQINLVHCRLVQFSRLYALISRCLGYSINTLRTRKSDYGAHIGLSAAPVQSLAAPPTCVTPVAAARVMFRGEEPEGTRLAGWIHELRQLRVPLRDSGDTRLVFGPFLTRKSADGRSVGQSRRVCPGPGHGCGVRQVGPGRPVPIFSR